MVSVPTREIGIQAMKTLAELIRGKKVRPRRRVLDVELMVRRELRVALGSGRCRSPVMTENADVDDERPPICPACGVTMVPAALSAREAPAGDWICLECEETSKSD